MRVQSGWLATLSLSTLINREGALHPSNPALDSTKLAMVVGKERLHVKAYDKLLF